MRLPVRLVRASARNHCNSWDKNVVESRFHSISLTGVNTSNQQIIINEKSRKRLAVVDRKKIRRVLSIVRAVVQFAIKLSIRFY